MKYHIFAGAGVAQRLLKEKSEQVKTLENKFMKLLQDSGANVSWPFIKSYKNIIISKIRLNVIHVTILAALNIMYFCS